MEPRQPRHSATGAEEVASEPYSGLAAASRACARIDACAAVWHMAEINLHGDAVISREWAAGKQELYISCAGMGRFDLQACFP
jgi:hypothetical protein